MRCVASFSSFSSVVFLSFPSFSPHPPPPCSAQKEARAASALKALEQAQATGGQAKSGAGEITPASLARLSFAELIEYRNNNELSGILFNALGGGATAAAGAGEEDDVEAGGGGANKRSLTTVHPSGPLGYYLRLSDWCYQLVEDERFTALVTFFIVLASVAVGLETDTAVMASRTAVLTLRYLDLLITWVFVAECVVVAFVEATRALCVLTPAPPPVRPQVRAEDLRGEPHSSRLLQVGVELLRLPHRRLLVRLWRSRQGTLRRTAAFPPRAAPLTPPTP